MAIALNSRVNNVSGEYGPFGLNVPSLPQDLVRALPEVGNEDLPDRRQTFPVDLHNTFGSAKSVQTYPRLEGAGRRPSHSPGENSNTWWLSWGAVNKPTPACCLLTRAAPEWKTVQHLSRSWVPEPRLCVEVSPTICSQYHSTSCTSSGSPPLSEVTFPVPMARVTVRRLGRQGPRSRLPCTSHSTGPLNPPAGGEPTSWGQAHYALSGCAQPGPVGKDLATRRSPASPYPRPGSWMAVMPFWAMCMFLA